MENNSYKTGLLDGLPIALGYLSVSFAFGIFSSGAGLLIWQSVLVSLFNITSAGQLAAVPIIASLGSLLELCLIELIINLRYSLMSVSLSQKLSPSVSVFDRLIIAFVNTDEVFATAHSKDGLLGKRYMFGLITLPYIGWAAGTFIGAFAGEILPPVLISALGIAIYAMFIAIVVPKSRSDGRVSAAALLSIAISVLMRYAPVLRDIPSGFSVIISACLVSLVLAWLCPIEDEGGEGGEDASSAGAGGDGDA